MSGQDQITNYFDPRNCEDCGAGIYNETDYMVSDTLWLTVTGRKECNLCPLCFEVRLGRPLTPADFTRYLINEDIEANLAFLRQLGREALLGQFPPTPKPTVPWTEEAANEYESAGTRFESLFPEVDAEESEAYLDLVQHRSEAIAKRLGKSVVRWVQVLEAVLEIETEREAKDAG